MSLHRINVCMEMCYTKYGMLGSFKKQDYKLHILILSINYSNIMHIAMTSINNQWISQDV